MYVKIYQISCDKDKRNLRFMNFEFVNRYGGVDLSEYDLVYEGDVDASNLEDVYIIFNRYDRMPAGYTGCSLSVSDIIETEDGTCWFVDSVGFTDISKGTVEEDSNE
jgi:hypothetical protein